MRKLTKKVVAGIVLSSMLMTMGVMTSANEEAVTSTLISSLLTPDKVYAEGEGLLPPDEDVIISHLVNTYMMGDLDRNFCVSLEDVLKILKMSLGVESANAAYTTFVADVDGNGKTELTDCLLTLKQALGVSETDNNIDSISDIDGNATAFIEKRAAGNEVRLITNAEELKAFLVGDEESYVKNITEKYEQKLQECDIVAIRNEVFTDDAKNIKCYTTVNNRQIFVQLIEKKNTDEKSGYAFTKFVCIKKDNSDKKITVDNTGIIKSVQELCFESNKGEDTVLYEEATNYINMVRTEEELLAYKTFIKEKFNDNLENDVAFNNGIDNLYKKIKKDNGLVCLTYKATVGQFEYQIENMEVEEGVLNLKLKYVDKNLSGVPSERYLTSCQAIVVPRELIEKATEVKLTIVSE